MRKASTVRELAGPAAVLATLDEVADLAEFQVADFRDHTAAVHAPTGAYVGISPRGSLVLCRGPAWMEAGLWRADVDAEATAVHAGRPIPASSVTLGMIR